MNLGPHTAFIVAAYGCAIVVIAALIGWITIDRRSLTRSLADLEQRGITRRSARGREDA